MFRLHLVRLLSVLMLLTVAACSSPDAPLVAPATTTTTTLQPAASTTTSTGSTAPVATTAPATTPSTTTPSTTLVTGTTALNEAGTVLTVAEIPFTSQLSLDVLAPTANESYPVVVLFHGGGWVGGEPEDVAPLAEAIAEAGAVVFNSPYRTALEGGGYPATFEDAACAVRFARRVGPSYGGDAGSIIVVGYSAGAHIGAVTALAGDAFDGDCLADDGSALPDAFVGVAGPYDSDVFDPLLRIFFGTDPAEDPDPWQAGNPYTYVGENPDLKVRLIQGRLDLLVPAGFAVDFGTALEAAGYDVELTIIEDGDHGTVVDPEENGRTVVAAVTDL